MRPAEKSRSGNDQQSNLTIVRREIMENDHGFCEHARSFLSFVVANEVRFDQTHG
jgi:hypothetical protein